MENKNVVNGQSAPIRRKVRELLSERGLENPEKNTKRERFLDVLKNRYGYTNEKAIDELERLLKQFYRTNRSLGIRRARTNYVRRLVE
jgi:hypothetical protein